jgi:biopolymer transport protein ExbD
MRNIAFAEIRSDINVTPLVDVVLVLLIIFMVITPLLQQGYELTVPKDRPEAVALPQEDQIVVSLNKDGSLALNRRAIPEEALVETLSSILKGRTSKTVFFSGDDEVGYEKAIAVIDTLRAAGATRIGIAPSPAELASK